MSTYPRQGDAAGALARRLGPPGPRTLEYLRGAAAGETQAETAARLVVTEEAVKDARRRIIARLGARNMAHAVAIAYRRGLLP